MTTLRQKMIDATQVRWAEKIARIRALLEKASEAGEPLRRRHPATPLRAIPWAGEVDNPITDCV